MNVANTTILSVLLSFYFSPVLADTSSLSDEQLRVLKEISANSQKAKEARELLSARAKAATSAPPQAQEQVRASPIAPASAKSQTDTITTILTKNEKKPPAEQQYSPCAGVEFLLRQSWTDIGIISGSQCPTTVDKAQGAQISFTDDRVVGNRVFAINGTAALVYNSVTGSTPNAITPYDIAFGVYTTVNDLTNSAVSKAKSNVNTVAYGGLLELGFTTSGGANYFRIRGGAVQDNLMDTNVANAKFEWMPVYFPLNIHYPFQIPGIPVIARFDPVFLAQYDSATGVNELVAFNDRREAFRLGPQFAVNLFPLPGAPDFVSHFSSLITYDWDYETYSGKSLYWISAALTYNIDQAGHIGLKASYQRGREENSGVLTNMYMLGLSGKI